MKEREWSVVTTGLVQSSQARLFRLLVTWKQKVLDQILRLNLIVNLIIFIIKRLQHFCDVTAPFNNMEILLKSPVTFPLTSII